MPRSSRAAIGLLALGIAIATLAGPASPALAHDALIDTTPAAGAEVAAAPTEVSLTFSGEILDGVTSDAVVVSVVGPDDTMISEGDPVIEGATVTQALIPNAPEGRYSVTWRVVSSDGHPISSDFHYFVVAGSAAAPTATPTETPSPTPSSTASATPPTPDASEPAAYGGRATAGGEMLPIVLVTGIVIVLGGLVIVVLRLRGVRRTRDERAAGSAPGRSSKDAADGW